MGILHILGILLIHEGYDIIDIILNLIPNNIFIIIAIDQRIFR